MRREEEEILLIRNILEGENESQRVFYDKYRQILNDYILSKYPYNSDIEDDVSEILIKVFTNLYKYDPEKAGVKTWIFAIAKNHMIDKFKKVDVLTGSISIESGGANTVLMLDGTGELCWDSITTSQVQMTLDDSANIHYTSSYATDFENCDALSHVSNSLNACDFSFLDMKYGQGFNYNEIGMEFNLTSTTVSNRVQYIKGKLKESMSYDIE